MNETLRSKLEAIIAALQAQLPNADKADASGAGARSKAGTAVRAAAQSAKAALDDVRKTVIILRDDE